MKGLDTLIKLHQRTLDELRRQIALLENQKQQLLELSKKLSAELKNEVAVANTQSELSQFFGGFAKRIQTRQQGIAEEVKSLDKKISVLTDSARVAFGEVKKYEIAKANAEKRKAKEVARKETAALDEIAGNQHRRKQES
jgi:flagellar FliJ protein